MAIEVLFVCRDNATRSIIAEAVLNGMTDGDFLASSAGFDSRDADPLTIRALEENFLRSGHMQAGCVDKLAGQAFDYVIVLAGRDEPVPEPPVTARIGHFRWDFHDPSKIDPPEQRLQALQQMIVELRLRVALFIAVARREARSYHTLKEALATTSSA